MEEVDGILVISGKSKAVLAIKNIMRIFYNVFLILNQAIV